MFEAMGANLLQFVRAAAALLLLSHVAAAETPWMKSRSAPQISLFFYFGILVAGFFGIWLWMNGRRLGFSISCIAFALLAFGGMTEYSVRKQYCNQMGEDIQPGRQLWCTNGVRPPPVDWSRDWGHLLGF